MKSGKPTKWRDTKTGELKDTTAKFVQCCKGLASPGGFRWGNVIRDTAQYLPQLPATQKLDKNNKPRPQSLMRFVRGRH